MSEMLVARNCLRCGGLLKKFDHRLYNCVNCGIKYILLGEEYPSPGLTQVIDESTSETVVGMYLWNPLYVRWDSPQEVKDEARVMGIEILDVPTIYLSDEDTPDG